MPSTDAALRILQWSRDLEVAERLGFRPFSQPFHGHLQWSRDLEVAERLAPLQVFYPNKLLQWSRDLEVAESCNPSRSTLPLKPFNGAATWKSRKGTGQGLPAFRRTPSMEPRLGSRGKSRSRVLAANVWPPSMEPRLGSRGKLTCAWCDANGSQPSMEPRLGSRGKVNGFNLVADPKIELQWSRDLEVAESSTKKIRVLFLS